MKKKTLYITMLVLSISFLLAMYVLKFFFPQEFMLSIQSDKIIQIGTFIDEHIVLRHICGGITSFITYWLFCCACSRRWKLKWIECLYIIILVVLLRLTSLIDSNIATHLSFCGFFVLPALMKGDIKICSLVFFVHGFAQCFMLTIRNLPIYLFTANFLTILLVTLDCYLWLILFYIIFNIKKENKND